MTGLSDNSGAHEGQSNNDVVSKTPSRRHFGLKMVLSIGIMALGTLAYSYNAGIIASTMGQPSFFVYMGLVENSHASALIGASTSMYYCGGIFGAIAAQYSADSLGRKGTMYIGAIICLASAALCAGSVNITMFIVFRFTLGLGGFMQFVVIPLWITEVVPAEVRGAFAQCFQVSVSLGYVLSSYVGVGFFNNKSVQGNRAWRGPVAVGVLPSMLFLCGVWWVAESPRFLLLKGRSEQAWDIVRRLHARPEDNDTSYAEKEMFIMKAQIDLDRTQPSSWMYMLRTPSMRKRMWMTSFIIFAILSTSGLSLATYMTVIMKDSGWDSYAQLNIQAGMVAAVMPGLIGAIFFTEKFRRPTMVALGLCGQFIFLSVYVAVTASYDLAAGGHKGAQIASIILLYCLQIWGCAFAEGPLAYWAAEFYPTHLRARGQTVTVVSFGAFCILWGQSTPSALANIGWKFFLIFIGITVVTTVVIYWYFPDTQGKTLEEIALLFGDNDLVVQHQEDIKLNDERLVTGKGLTEEGRLVVSQCEHVEISTA